MSVMFFREVQCRRDLLISAYYSMLLRIKQDMEDSGHSIDNKSGETGIV